MKLIQFDIWNNISQYIDDTTKVTQKYMGAKKLISYEDNWGDYWDINIGADSQFKKCPLEELTFSDNCTNTYNDDTNHLITGDYRIIKHGNKISI